MRDNLEKKLGTEIRYSQLYPDAVWQKEDTQNHSPLFFFHLGLLQSLDQGWIVHLDPYKKKLPGKTYLLHLMMTKKIKGCYELRLKSDH